MIRWVRILPSTVAAAALLHGVAIAQPATDIYIAELAERDGKITLLGPPVPVTDRDGYDNQPAFTPDGRSLFYTSIRDDQADIYRFELTTGRTHQVTRTPESEYSPTPIPGSDRFSVVRVEADATQRLWSFAQDGSDPRLILERVAPVGYHAWLGTETVALFILGDPATLQVGDLTTGSARLIAADIGRSLQPVPARASVTFTQRSPATEDSTSGAWWLLEADIATGATHRVAPLLGDDADHAWTPAGALLTTHGTSIFQLSEHGRWRQVADLAHFGLGQLTRLAASPDGNRLAIVADRPTGDDLED